MFADMLYKNSPKNSILQPVEKVPKFTTVNCNLMKNLVKFVHLLAQCPVYTHTLQI
jgi:hypothetical protein